MRIPFTPTMDDYFIIFLETLRNTESTHLNFDLYNYFQKNHEKQSTVKKNDFELKYEFCSAECIIKSRSI